LQMRGLIRIRHGQLAAAASDCATSRSLFAQIGDAAAAASVTHLEATSVWYLGERDRAWAVWKTVFENAGGLPAIQRHVILRDSASMALRDGMPAAAERLARLDAASIDSLPAAARSESHLLLARVLDALGQRSLAVEAVSAAAAAARSAGDPPLVSRLTAEVAMARAEMGLRMHNPSAAADANTAISYFDARSFGFRAAKLRLLRARLANLSGNREAALADLREGVTIFEGQLPDQKDFRARFLDDASDLYVEWLEAERRRGTPVERLLEIAERSRARDLLEARRGRPLTAGEIKAALPESVALVEFFARPSRLMAFLVTSKGIRSEDLALAPAEAASLSEGLRDAVRSGDRLLLRRSGTELYQRLLSPFAAQIRGRTLVIVADSVLAPLPFPALVDPATGRYLIEDHELVFAPSASALALALAHVQDARPVQNALCLHAAEGGQGSKRLPHAEAEAREVAGLYPSSRLLAGRSFTPILWSDLQQYDVIHFAGHAIANDTVPELSQLILDASSGAALLSLDIRKLDLARARVVFLSACDTAKGPALRGEGILSLARSFLVSGARSVVATSWEVPDETARHVAVSFHRYVSAGASPSSALSRAQRESIGKLPVSTWAAFALFGAPG